MQFSNAMAMTERYIRNWTNDWIQSVKMIYWPLIEILIMGYTALWLTSPGLVQVILASAILWQVVVRVNYEIMENLLLECWASNITNLFASPLTLSEWILSAFMLGLLIQLFIIVFGALIVYAFFGYSFLSLGPFVLVILFNLYISGFSLGLFSCGFIIYKGSKVASFVYMIGWAFALTSGVYFSLDVLPHSIQVIAKGLPLIYGFDLLRDYMINQEIAYTKLWVALFLNMVYFVLAIAFFYWQFERSRNRGLEHLLK